MQGFFEKLAEFLLPSRKTFTNKLYLVLGLGGLILLLDNTIGVSYYYQTSKKTDLILRLNEAANNYNTDSTGRAYAAQLRNDVYYRKGIIDQAGSFLLSPFRRYSIKDRTHHPNNAPVINTCNDSMNTYFIISAAGTPFTFAILGFIGVFFYNGPFNGFWERLAAGVLVSMACVIFGVLIMAFIGLIPQLSKQSCYPNYIVNAIIQAVALIALVKLVNRATYPKKS